jgi:hypothetical protein
MKPEEQRIAIAEACGIYVCNGCYHKIDPNICHCGKPTKNHGYQVGHNEVPMGCTCGYSDAEDRRQTTPECPDYLNDLNAMKEAKDTLTPEQKDVFAGFLGKIVEYGRVDFGAMQVIATTKILFSTAAQQAEAFLRTIGKWKPTK